MTKDRLEEKAKSVSWAQFRMLTRLLRGEKLPCDRYHSGTIQALARKRCVVAEGGFWGITALGREMMSRRMRPFVPRAPESTASVPS